MPANDGLILVMMHCLSWQSQYMPFREMAFNQQIDVRDGEAEVA